MFDVAKFLIGVGGFLIYSNRIVGFCCLGSNFPYKELLSQTLGPSNILRSTPRVVKFTFSSRSLVSCYAIKEYGLVLWEYTKRRSAELSFGKKKTFVPVGLSRIDFAYYTALK